MAIEYNRNNNKSLGDSSMLQKCLTFLGYGRVGRLPEEAASGHVLNDG